MNLSSVNDENASKASRIRISMKNFLHWIYSIRIDLRRSIRRTLCHTSLAVSVSAKGRGGDAGKSRKHVLPILQVRSSGYKRCSYFLIISGVGYIVDN